MGGLFSIFHKKSASKAPKTCDLAYFTSQWGGSSSPRPPWLRYCLYGCHLWHNYTQYTFKRIRVGYNDAYRILHSIPRFMSANEGLVAAEIPTFQALIRRNIYGFVQRCLKSPNNWIKSLMNSNSFSLSKYYEYYNRTLLV